jgi:hypothetical protein
MEQAVRAWVDSRGGTIHSWTVDETRSCDLIAVEARVEAPSEVSAVELIQQRLSPIIRAVAFRQLRPGHVLAWLAVAEQGGTTYVHHQYSDPPKVYNIGFDESWSPQIDIEAIAAAISEAPTGALFAGLFADALAEMTVEGMIVRLWSLLEAMSRPFWQPDKTRKADLRMVERAMAHLGIVQPMLADAYHHRNLFIHQGLGGDPQEAVLLRSALVRLVFEALWRGRFCPIEPDRAPTPVGQHRGQRVLRRASQGPPDRT